MNGDRHLADPVDWVSTPFVDYYRCPSGSIELEPAPRLSADAGYFAFDTTVCYGRVAAHEPSRRADGDLVDVFGQVRANDGRIRLPFDFTEVVTNLRHERYAQTISSPFQLIAGLSTSRSVYHSLRPFLPVTVRKHLQRLGLSGWDRIPFPKWPVDVTVDVLMEGAMKLALKYSGQPEIPFIWFWPEGASSCAMMTHDVESPVGRDFCDQLMDLDETGGLKAAFQIVPEGRYTVSRSFLEDIRRRGYEINVHDLDHDGRLFQNRGEFLRRAARINDHLARFGSRGFRAGVMYRKQEWLEALDISYDMSVPNVAHLEPQRGGCCTVMPYFIGNILELPLTTAQDYSLLHILGDYSIELWKEQVELILAKHGLISFITHPDYLVERRARRVYEDLLAYLGHLRSARGTWLALPDEVDDWWRKRSQMRLVRSASGWSISGPDHQRARIAFARIESDRLVYNVAETSAQ